MIDIKNLVFDTVYNGITAEHDNVNVTSGFVEEAATYPCIVVREVSNVPYQRTDTDTCGENYTRLVYQIEAYSDKAGTSESESRDLLKLADTIMQGMKFRRIYMSEPFNVNRTITRIYARYAVIVDTGVVEGNDTVYHMYRR